MSKRVPSYALDPVKAFINYLDASGKLLHLSMRAIAMTRAMPQMVEAIATASRGDSDWDEQRHVVGLEKAKNDAEFAKNECDTGFSLLHEFTLVGTWGAFEVAIEDLVVGVLCNEPQLLRAEPFAKIRIPLAEFEILDNEGRMRILLRELQRTLRSDQRNGVGAFEAILGAVGLSGEVKKDCRERIWEMNHIRNAVVHRRSRADRTFIGACPKLGLNIGDQISITHNQLGEYAGALAGYATEIVYRMGARYGVEMSPRS
ncbi:MAG TPA: hypothetical protein VMI32_17570 [Candidatus Solibacter sp.]|nr:hypothetical protein [Candidatus Solibacter sp.]